MVTNLGFGIRKFREERSGPHPQVRPLLPTVGHHEVFLPALAAGQIQHKALLAHGAHHRRQPRLVHGAITEDVRRDDDVRRAGVQERGRRLRRDSAAHLGVRDQGLGIRGQGVGSRG